MRARTLLILCVLAACSKQAEKSATSAARRAPSVDVGTPSEASDQPWERPLISVTLQPAEPKPGENLHAFVDDPVPGRIYIYTWTVDGQGVSGETGAQLDGTYVKKGRRIAVTVTPRLNGHDGPIMTSEAVSVGNTPPSFQSIDIISQSPSEVVFASRAYDFDGDDLRFRLIAAPPGMTLDESSGDIRWRLPTEGLAEPVTFAVLASDGQDAVILEHRVSTRAQP